MMITENEYKNLIAFHPGEYVEEIIEDLNITQNEFATRLGTSAKTISKIVNKEESISVDIANKLAKLTGISFETWMNLQMIYEEKMIEIQEEKDKDESYVVSNIDFNYFKSEGYVRNKRYSIEEKKSELRKLFNVSTLSIMCEFNPNISYRSTQDFSAKSIINSNVMLELASNKARHKTSNKLNKKRLVSNLDDIKSMTFLTSDEFLPRLEANLLESGVVLVVLTHLKNANLNGAVKRFKNGSVLLLVTDRSKTSDVFWFSLMHEISHILNSDFNTDYRDKEEYLQKENIANEFAKNFFIKEEIYNNFVEIGDFSISSIKSMANKCKIDPAIIVGRLQFDGYLKYNDYNHLKRSLKFNS